MTSVDFSEKALLILVHKPDHPGIQQTVMRILNDKDTVHLVNTCFNPMGMLSTSPEIKVLLRFLDPSSLPCLIILRLSKSPSRSIIFDLMIPLSHDPTIESVHGCLLAYCKSRNSQGGRLKALERGALAAIGQRALDGERAYAVCDAGSELSKTPTMQQ